MDREGIIDGSGTLEHLCNNNSRSLKRGVPMPKNNLEERVAVLERQVQQLIESKTRRNRVRDWRDSVGMFTGNELMKEIDRAGAAIRIRERRQARHASAKRSRRTKS